MYKRQAEYDGFGCRVDSQLFVAGNQSVDKLKFITGIAAHTVEKFTDTTKSGLSWLVCWMPLAESDYSCSHEYSG